MKKRDTWIVYLILLLSCMGCSEFIEEPLRKKEITLLSPGEGATLDFNDIEFRWNVLDFAIDYHLQIARPSFDSAAYFLADTIVEANHFAITLSPGDFEWRVKGRNGSSETNVTTSKFRIITVKKK